ncbi:unnamed protein product [Rotaria socialis]|uniref:Uncharacterized protein n=1 Tax=Rotaria socialis TaxID=392032 RepID=A0A817W5I4_9BILA|nr:unnamed protein product [Rotaria socialis]CAF4337114.1 unnamed protein product [Rotaria socialis]
MDSVNFAPGKVYGVLRANVIADNGESYSHKSGASHYNLLSVDNQQSETPEEYQINIDIQSLQSANVKCISIDPFITSLIPFSSIPFGFTSLESNDTNELALDLVRRPVFDLNLLIESQPLTADEIAMKLDVYFKNNKPNVIIFGTKYDDKHTLEESHYGLQRAQRENKPARGINDIHMNQIVREDGRAYQDGALFIQNNDQDNTYAAFFFCFDNQCKTEASSEENSIDHHHHHHHD